MDPKTFLNNSQAGLGLFTAMPIKRGQPITTYAGPQRYKDQLSEVS